MPYLPDSLEYISLDEYNILMHDNCYEEEYPTLDELSYVNALLSPSQSSEICPVPKGDNLLPISFNDMGDVQITGKKVAKKRPPGLIANYNPPTNKSVLTGNHTFRFQQLNASTQIVTLYAKDIAFMMCTAKSPSSYGCIWEAVKINRISIWAPNYRGGAAGIGGDPVTCSIEWLGEYSPNSEFSATTNTLGHNAHLHCVPPKNAQSGKWNRPDSSDAEPLCKMRIPHDSIMDISVSFVYRDDAASGIVKATVNSLATGNLYYSAIPAYFNPAVLTPVSLIPAS
jgi:hypothetical protein